MVTTNDVVSGVTSYGVGTFAVLLQQDLSTYVAVAGLVLVIVRIAGDVPRGITAWRQLFNKEDTDDGNAG